MQEDSEPEREDADLAAAVAAGDTGAFGQLYDRHSSRLLGVALAILKNRREAEDLLHDVFMELWQKAGAFDPSKGTLDYWLVLRVRCRAIDRQRAAHTKRTYEDSISLETSEPSTDDSDLQMYELTEAIETLSEPQRDVIVLSYIQGYSCSEISRLIDVPVGTIKSRLQSALKVMRTKFEIASGASA